MSNKFDVIVMGLGAMGSASLYQLAKLGLKVLGIDRFAPPHSLGSTHGETRITRQAIGEGEHYCALSLRSYEIFREMENLTGRSLLQVTGGLIISSDNKASYVHVDNLYKVTVSAAKRYGIKHEIFDAKDIRARFPQFNISDTEYGYYEYEAGVLRPEECVRANLECAKLSGASIKTNTVVKSFREEGYGVRVVCEDGDEFTAGKLVVSVGSWLPELLSSDLSKHFTVHRQVLFWFDVHDAYDSFVPGKMPIWIWEVQNPGTESMYGFPALDGPNGGIKLASENLETPTSPFTVEREVTEAEIARMREVQVQRYFPTIGSRCVKTAVCLYTATPDAEFVIDFAPGSDRVLIVSPCSGHGFKHSAAIGESVAELCFQGSSSIDISRMSLKRFTAELGTTYGA